MLNSFHAKSTLAVGGKSYSIFKLAAVEKLFPAAKSLPFSLKVLLENLLRTENNLSVRKADIEALANWNPKAEPDAEIAFTPARVLMQDFTGVPCVVDLAAMRDAMKNLGGDPGKINPLVPVELVIDHSVQVDENGTPTAFAANTKLEYERNQERYTFLRWGQTAFNNFKVVPPETGIVHQVNCEFLARVIFVDDAGTAYPDTLVGTDSHTTMVNGLGVLGWGVGGIEAEAAMLGQPVTMLIPQVVGFKLIGKLKEGATATDLVLTVTQMLRKKGVVGKFVEFFGPGLAQLSLADRLTIANMAPEYGATCGIFPVDAETIKYLKQTGRSEEQLALVEAYCKEQGFFHDANTPAATYTDTMELDVSTVVPSLAGPMRPQDRVALSDMKKNFGDNLPKLKEAAKKAASLPMAGTVTNESGTLTDGSVVIAAITSCTNTSNPNVMVAAGIVAKKANAKGLTTKPWVKTSLAPGSKVVTEYLTNSKLLAELEKQRFHVVGYGCTTCIVEGTPILMANGTGRRIEQFPNAGGSLVLAPDADGRLNIAEQVELLPRGNRDCVTLTFQDGRSLTCTPDHELLTANGEWVRADHLILDQDRVVSGLEVPTDEVGDDERGFVLEVGSFTFHLETPNDRYRSLAFARLLGHLLGDGSISTYGQGRMNLGQAIDREAVLNDIEVVTGKRPAGSQYDERKWSIALPMEFTAAIAGLPGVVVGKRIDQPATLPAFIVDHRCPVALVREFLGGVFGADGQAPVLKWHDDNPESAILEQPGYSQSSKAENVPALCGVLEQLAMLLRRCGVNTEGYRVYQYPVRRSESSYPAGKDGEPRTEVRLELPDGLTFIQQVGFRYSIDKTLRCGAAAVYWRIIEEIHRQRLWMSDRLLAIHAEFPSLSFSRARAMAASELHRMEPVVFSHYATLQGYDRFSRLPQASDRKFQPLHRASCGFPSPVELLTELGVRDWFAPLQSREETDYSKRYCLDKNSLSLPTFALKLLDRRPAGEKRVYDLSVKTLHAFVAGGVSVHNCIGNSGPLSDSISKEIGSKALVVSAVLSGNRNFEGRVHSEVRANYLASPPLVVAYALAGKVDIDWETESLGQGNDGNDVFLKDIWPTQKEVQDVIDSAITRESYQKTYASVYDGDENWRALTIPTGDRYAWVPSSTYIANPPYFDGMSTTPPPVKDIVAARCLAVLGDSITTDHISPAGNIKRDSPAGKYLIGNGVEQKDFNQYGARRGHHDVMMRGTFANVRLKNLLVPGIEGGVTRYLPTNEQMSIFDASMKYQQAGTPLVILGGKEYGSGSSRDWAAKGTNLLGVKAVVAESYERIHRSNLVGMGVLPLQFQSGDTVTSLGLTGEETFEIPGIVEALKKVGSGKVMVTVKAGAKSFEALLRVDTPQEVLYYQHGGILPYVLRQLLAKA